MEAVIEKPRPAKLVKMTLTRHYRPAGEFEVVGHNLPEIMRKGADGRMHVIQQAAFVPDAPMPPKTPGVGIPGKLWAGTILKLPEAEARTLRKNGIAEIEFAD